MYVNYLLESGLIGFYKVCINKWVNRYQNDIYTSSLISVRKMFINYPLESGLIDVYKYVLTSELICTRLTFISSSLICI